MLKKFVDIMVEFGWSSFGKGEIWTSSSHIMPDALLSKSTGRFTRPKILVVEVKPPSCSLLELKKGITQCESYTNLLHPNANSTICLVMPENLKEEAMELAFCLPVSFELVFYNELLKFRSPEHEYYTSGIPRIIHL